MYATDAILATLMCCTRSNYSWDIVIQKIGGKLFFDKRDNTEFGKYSTKYCSTILMNSVGSGGTIAKRQKKIMFKLIVNKWKR